MLKLCSIKVKVMSSCMVMYTLLQSLSDCQISDCQCLPPHLTTFLNQPWCGARSGTDNQLIVGPSPSTRGPSLRMKTRIGSQVGCSAVIPLEHPDDKAQKGVGGCAKQPSACYCHNFTGCLVRLQIAYTISLEQSDSS